MTGLIAALLGLIILFVLFFFPWLTVPMLLVVPVAKGGAEYYVPFFQSVDLTFVTCALAGAVGLWNLIRARRPGAPLAIPWAQFGCLLVLGFALLVGLAWTSAPNYGLRKAYRFLGIGVPFLLLPAFLVRTKEEGHRMIRGIIVVGALVAVAVVALPETYFAQIAYGRGYARGTVLGSSPVIPAVLASIAMLTLLCFYLVKGSASRALRYTVLLVLPFGLFTILKTGTRSAFFGLVAIVVMLPWLAGRGSRVKGIFLTFVVLPLMGTFAFVLIEAATGPSLERWNRFTRSGATEELIEGRTHHFAFCLQNWWRRPILGHGSGSFAVDAFNRDEPAWPHNIILEAMYETGLVGTTALVAFLWIIIRTGRRGLKFAVDPGDRFLVLAPAVMVVVLLIQGLTHWDIDGVRFLYLFAGLLHANVSLVARNPIRIAR